jgi:plastocyanin
MGNRLAGLITLAVLLSVAVSAGANEVHEITVTAQGFEPAELTIQRGDVVRWECDSGRYSIISGEGPEDENAGERFQFVIDEETRFKELTFETVDVFPYFSRLGPDLVKGTITVTRSTPVDNATWGWVKRMFEGTGPSGSPRR